MPVLAPFVPEIVGAVASAGVGAGLSAIVNKSPSVAIPPPPGAAMLDPAGSAGAAAARRRQAIAGGLQSTIGAGANPSTAPVGNATSGSKQLLGA